MYNGASGERAGRVRTVAKARCLSPPKFAVSHSTTQQLTNLLRFFGLHFRNLFRKLDWNTRRQSERIATIVIHVLPASFCEAASPSLHQQLLSSSRESCGRPAAAGAIKHRGRSAAGPLHYRRQPPSTSNGTRPSLRLQSASEWMSEWVNCSRLYRV